MSADESTVTEDQILASAVRYLIEGGEEEAASVLLSCSINLTCLDSWTFSNGQHFKMKLELRGPRTAYEILHNTNHAIHLAVRRAFDAVMPSDSEVEWFSVLADLTDVDPEWRKELLEIARGRGVDNQATEGKSLRTWNNFRFRSESEVRIAQAFDRREVMFLPNCKGRLNSPKGRCNREADFLVFHGGKWGILEVDGEPFHPPSRTVQDHERDRLFRSHGVLVVEHFDASDCYNRPDAVVQQFLSILENT